MGVLTADAKDPHSFDNLEPRFLKAVGAMAGAQIQTVNLIEALEQSAKQHGQIADELMRDVQIGKDKQIIGSSPATLENWRTFYQDQFSRPRLNSPQENNSL